MKKYSLQFAAFLVFVVGALRAGAGTIFYVPISPTQSDEKSGLSTSSGYTTAVDGGNAGTDRVVNGITLYALPGDSQSRTADNCTLTALSGSLANGAGAVKNIQADGTLREVLSDMTFNNGAGDNSQQEIVLDPESLEEGATYDLRVYICNSSGQNRLVNLAFAGDGQEAVETGFFNEDDATTSAGGFKDPNQAYYMNYRYTWDGDSTPGITITQKSGSAPFCLYALTNQLVTGAGGAAAGEAAAAGGEAAAAGEEGEGLSSGFVTAESDEVGVSSDDFYSSESLNAHGRWVKLAKWGRCWQPTDVQAGWCPYTNGTFKNCDDCGWTFVSEEPWAWACYHYGRWAKVDFGCGWCWVPGKVWAGSWVSWRRGRTESCECIGWAPLPPEAGCELDVGISSWVDHRCDIGPDCYTFVNVRDFGSDSYWGCNCIWDRSRNTTVIIDTFNCTSISHTRWGTYCGGIDVNWCNTEIRRRGGKECETVIVDRWDNPGKLGGKYSHKEGNRLGLVSPHIKGERNPKHMPKIVDTFGTDKIDHGWKGVKDPGARQQLKNHIAEESKGKSPKNTRAQLPGDVAEKMRKHHREIGQAGGMQPGSGGRHPGGKGRKGVGTETLAGQAPGGGFNQHPGGKGKQKAQGQLGASATGGPAGGDRSDQHPGGKGHKGKAAGVGTQTAAGGREAGPSATGARHPGQSLKRGKGAQAGVAGPAGTTGPESSAVSQGGPGQHPGKKGKRAQQFGEPGPAQSLQGETGQTAGGGQAGPAGKGRHKQRQQTQTLQGGEQGAQGGQGQYGAGEKTGKGRRKQQQAQQAQQPQAQPEGYGEPAAAGGGRKHRKQQQAQQVQQPQAQPEGYGQPAAGGGGGRKHRKQQQAQQVQQPQAQPEGYGQPAAGGGGGKKHRTQQQAQQVQQPQGQPQGYGQPMGGGGGRQRKQQQLQQQQPNQGQLQGQPQGQRGRKGKAIPTPAPY